MDDGSLMIRYRFTRRTEKTLPPNIDVADTVLRTKLAPGLLETNRSALAFVETRSELLQFSGKLLTIAQLDHIPSYISKSFQYPYELMMPELKRSGSQEQHAVELLSHCPIASAQILFRID